MFILGAAALLAFGFFALGPIVLKPRTLEAYAKGEMADLEVGAGPPKQPSEIFEDAEGEVVRLSDFHGEFIVLNLWATWCAPCQAEMPTLATLDRRFRNRGLRVLVVSMDMENKRDEARAMLAELSQGDLDFYIDPTRRIAFAVDAPGLPATIIYDREGRELARLAGGADWSSPEAYALMEAIVDD